MAQPLYLTRQRRFFYSCCFVLMRNPLDEFLSPFSLANAPTIDVVSGSVFFLLRNSQQSFGAMSKRGHRHSQNRKSRALVDDDDEAARRGAVWCKECYSLLIYRDEFLRRSFPTPKLSRFHCDGLHPIDESERRTLGYNWSEQLQHLQSTRALTQQKGPRKIKEHKGRGPFESLYAIYFKGRYVVRPRE